MKDTFWKEKLFRRGNRGEIDYRIDLRFKTIDILELLQQKKYDEADLYFRKTCVLINQKLASNIT